ncbi:hypothetical protein [Limosilactobacillus reuteri]|uniref:hypothetical protein n=1 Tax=Limosilactobacillus reuteri TaxID=1598 RepID=UPI000A1EF1CD|nr:hypothetical protein [Limosilactobacillus reuteri]
MEKQNLTPEELLEYKQLKTRIKELERKSNGLTRKQLKEKFAKIMKFNPRPKGMRIKKWQESRRKSAITMHGQMKYGEWAFSRKFRVTIKYKKTIELYSITYSFEVLHGNERLLFTSAKAVYNYLDKLSKKELIGLRIQVYPLLDNKNMLDGFGHIMVASYSYVGFLYHDSGIYNSL